MLDCIFHCHIRLCDGFAERIEVHAHEVDSVNVIVLQLFHMFRNVAAGKKGSVYFRVESFHAAVADFRKTCNVAYTCNRNA